MGDHMWQDFKNSATIVGFLASLAAIGYAIKAIFLAGIRVERIYYAVSTELLSNGGKSLKDRVEIIDDRLRAIEEKVNDPAMIAAVAPVAAVAAVAAVAESSAGRQHRRTD